MDKIKALIEERAKLDADSRALVDKAESEDRELSQEEKQQWEAMDKQIDVINDSVENCEIQDKQRKREQWLSESAGRRGVTPYGPGEREDAGADAGAPSPPQAKPYSYTLKNGVKREIPVIDASRATPEYGRAFGAYLRTGRVPQEFRAALQVDQDTGGGYMAAFETLIGGMIQAVDEKLIVRQLATVFSAR